MRLEVDWRDLAVVRVVGPRQTVQLFALRCSLCRRLTTGCAEHWFCGLCEPCRAGAERDDDDGAAA